MPAALRGAPVTGLGALPELSLALAARALQSCSSPDTCLVELVLYMARQVRCLVLGC